MNSPLTPNLRILIGGAMAVAQTHGIPLEAVLLHVLALGSALAGDLIRSKPTGSALVPAKFSLMLRTPDNELPYWVGDEWDYLLERQAQACHVSPAFAQDPKSIARLRRQRRVLMSLDGGADESVAEIDMMMAIARKRSRFSFFYRVSDRKAPFPPPANGRSLTLAAAGLSQLLPILRSRVKTTGYWSMINAPAHSRSNLVAWVGERDWPALRKEAGQEHLSRLGWMVECPASRFCPEHHVPCDVAASKMLQRLETVRFGAIKLTFAPPPEARELLDRHVAECLALVHALPAFQREAALPDPYIAWHLAAILAVVGCPPTQGEDTQHAFNQSARIGCLLATWVVRQHLYHFRHAFPSYHEDRLVDLDLRIFRLLGTHPATVREIQRRLRGVGKAACLASLARSVDAGLAVEAESGRFAVMPPPRGPDFTDVIDGTISPAAI